MNAKIRTENKMASVSRCIKIMETVRHLTMTDKEVYACCLNALTLTWAIWDSSSQARGRRESQVFKAAQAVCHHMQRCAAGTISSERNLTLIHNSEPTRRTPISYAVYCL